MKRSLFAVVFSLVIISSHAQTIDTVLPAGTVTCDTAAWKLVFSDDFTDTVLDRTKWHTYAVWAGKEDDDWGEARWGPNGARFQIYEDKNVVVRDGICHLQMTREPATWKCPSCPETRTTSYTSGQLQSYYTNQFSNGKFEARIKFPTFTKAHSAFWLWAGAPDERGQPEFDIAEAYGNPWWPVPFPAYNNRFNDYSIHFWGKNNGPHYEKMRRFPRQRYINYITGNYFAEEEWHTYTLEWEPASVSFYLDGKLMHRYTKYNTKKGKPAPCIIDTDSKWYVPVWYPPVVDGCNIHLSLGIDADVPSQPAGLVGEMLIDYVRVWQRHPEVDGHKSIATAQQ